MRNIYTDSITQVQQGCIFNGAKADGFENCTVYGLIITPRCDIAQCKVTTVHYLPIVKLEDWKKKILTPISQSERLRVTKDKVGSLLNKYSIPIHLMDRKYMLSDEDLEKSINEKDVLSKIKQPLKEYWDLQDMENCYDSLDKWNNYLNKLNDLANGRNERYLLLEKWNNDSQYHVICLTEIYHISFDTAMKLKDGILVRDVDFDRNELHRSDYGRYEYKILAQLSSPYIEYVTQRLSNAFFRIGIDDWNNKKQIIDRIK